MGLLKETFPHITQLAYLPTPSKMTTESAEWFAKKLGINLILADSLKDDNFERAIAGVTSADGSTT
jgi:hypothetical protein